MSETPAEGLALSSRAPARAGRLGAWSARWGLSLALSYAAVWWSLLLLNRCRGVVLSGDALAISLTIAKCVVLVLLGADLGRAGQRVAEGRASALHATLAWCAAWAAVLLVLVLLRDPLAQLARGTTVQFFWHGFEPAGPRGWPSETRALQAAWLLAWDSGRIALRELAFVPLWGLGLFALAHVAGRALGVFAGLWTLVSAGAWAFGMGLIEATYDIFHLGVLAGPVAFDLAVPLLPLPPGAPVTSLLWVALFAANRWVLRGERLDQPA